MGISSDRKRTTGTPKASKLTFLQSGFKLCRFRESYDANFFQMCINSLYGKALTPSTLCCKSAKFDEFLTNANCFFFLFFSSPKSFMYILSCCTLRSLHSRRMMTHLLDTCTKNAKLNPKNLCPIRQFHSQLHRIGQLCCRRGRGC